MKKIDIRYLFDLDNIPESELENQWVDLRTALITMGRGNRFGYCNGEFLKEEANSTLPVAEVKRELMSKLHMKDWQFAVTRGENGIELVVLYAGIIGNGKIIKNIMSACGWFLAERNFVFKNGRVWRMMGFDPVFQDNVINKAKMYDYLFHWTPLYNLKSIEENGLVPRSDSTYLKYPDRIYLLKGDISIPNMLSIGSQLCKRNKNKHNDGRYVLLMIDLRKLRDDIDICEDPRYRWGYFTTDSIPSDIISIFNAYDFFNSKKITI